MIEKILYLSKKTKNIDKMEVVREVVGCERTYKNISKVGKSAIQGEAKRAPFLKDIFKR